MKIIHIGYGDSAAGCLQAAIGNHGLAGDKVIPSRDDFTQGPISECGKKMETDQRQNYWKMIDKEVHFGMDIDIFYQESMLLLDHVNEAEVVLWQGDSCHDILASAWLMTYMENRNLKWSIIDISKLSPEELNDGLPPVNLAMFSPDQIVTLYKYKQTIGAEAQKMYRDLWSHLRSENGAYRIKSGHEISSVNENYHDDFILSHIPNDLTLAKEVIEKTIKKSELSITDTTVEWRIRHLIKSNKIYYTGELNGMNNYSVKRI